MKTTRAKTELRCDKCHHLKFADEKTMFKNNQKPWILFCPFSGIEIGTVPTAKGMDEQELPELPAPWDCKLRVKLRKAKVESSIQLSYNCL